MQLKWTSTLEERNLMERIANRAETLMKIEDRISLLMDLEAVHCNGCPLRLQDLLEADNFNFLHDILGIRRNIDRITGKLRNEFYPRFAKG